MGALAQVNVARLRAPLDDPSMRDLVAAVDAVHHLADTSPGFVWRLGGAGAHGLVVVTDDAHPALLNLSLWDDYESLHRFVYRSRHGQLVRHRRRWFDSTRQPSTALWWVCTDARPTIEVAARRLWHLRAYGPSPRAFSLRRRFTPTGAPERVLARH